MTEILDPIWQQQLTKSLHVNSSQVQSKYYQVASVCSNGEPKNRTMVFRGFLSGTQSLLSVTDSRSEKIEEWQGDNKSRFEICWYFAGSREQFRLAGEVALISNSLDPSYEDWVLGKQTKQSILKQQWSNLSTTAREPFYSNSPKAPFAENSMPSMPQNRLVNKGAVLKKKCNSNHTTPTNIVSNQADMSDNFCVIIFIPHTVDYLDLKSKPQQRCLYAIQDGWKERPVNP
jgi:pyridoxamine 5'-phosphate oxidase